MLFTIVPNDSFCLHPGRRVRPDPEIFLEQCDSILDDFLIPDEFQSHSPASLFLTEMRKMRNRNKSGERKKQQEKADEENIKKKQRFEVTLDIDGFKPEELDVKFVETEGRLVITGKHEGTDEQDGGFVSRQFTRSFTVPENVELDRMVCNFNKGKGRLSITAPKKVEVEEPPKVIEKVIPIQIQLNGGEQPAVGVENEKESEKGEKEQEVSIDKNN